MLHACMLAPAYFRILFRAATAPLLSLITGLRQEGCPWSLPFA